MTKLYSWERLLAFIVLLAGYGIVFVLLWWGDKANVVDFSHPDGVEHMLISMPFIALYIAILIGVAAGYARSAFAARSLGLMRAVRQQLRTRSMESSNIKSKIRSDSAVAMDTPLLRTLEKVVTARLPILPVVEDDKVSRVITMHNIMQELTHQINTVREESKTEELFGRIAGLKVEDIRPRSAVTCMENDNLESVLQKMIQHKLTKLVVVGKDGACMGTVDLFDIVSDILSESSEQVEAP